MGDLGDGPKRLVAERGGPNEFDLTSPQTDDFAAWRESTLWQGRRNTGCTSVKGVCVSKSIPHPEIASREEWLVRRKELLEKEKELTRRRDEVSAALRRLPMVKLEKHYVFEGENGATTLRDLFEGRRQLIVYHFMFDPDWDQGCLGCTGFVTSMGDLSMLPERDTSMALVSRAPWNKLKRYKERKGFTLPWVSSHGSDFNYDFNVTLDPSVAPIEYNYLDEAELEKRKDTRFVMTGEAHGLSVFFRLEDDVYHSYSSYARGVESLTDAYSLLDRTPYGRQEDFEDSPPGWPQRPTYS